MTETDHKSEFTTVWLPQGEHEDGITLRIAFCKALQEILMDEYRHLISESAAAEDMLVSARFANYALEVRHFWTCLQEGIES